MSYRQIKWLILVIPTITIGAWEYVRHEFLLPYISMEMGNWLAPLIVLVVTMTFLLKLFAMMEETQEELNRERTAKAALEERERIARELHDGIAQSLFLLSVKVNQLEKRTDNFEGKADVQLVRKTVHQVNGYVRQAISNLRYPPRADALPWRESIQDMVSAFEAETGVPVSMNWSLLEERLTPKEKVELYACIREALLNVRKHAEAEHVWITCREEETGWVCRIEDDGPGFDDGDPYRHEDRYGLRIMKERAKEMNWSVQMSRENDKTKVLIRKGGQA